MELRPESFHDLEHSRQREEPEQRLRSWNEPGMFKDWKDHVVTVL